MPIHKSRTKSQGVVIFAYANELIDYVALAAWSTLNIHRHLGLPVCVITDQTDLPSHYSFDQVIVTDKSSEYSRHFSDYDQPVTWYNRNRMDAFELSPWDQTLVLDADYVVASSQLKCLFSADQDFLAHGRAMEATGHPSFVENNTFGRHHVPMSWATVMMFRRSTTAQLIFDSMSMIQQHWRHYLDLYGISKKTYRNDIALSIAQLIVNGHGLQAPCIPWDLVSVEADHRLTQLEQDLYRVDYTGTNDQPRWLTLNHDFHAMGKRHLGDIVANKT